MAGEPTTTGENPRRRYGRPRRGSAAARGGRGPRRPAPRSPAATGPGATGPRGLGGLVRSGARRLGGSGRSGGDGGSGGSGGSGPAPWTRWRSALLAAGATASAVLAMMTLWDRVVPDPPVPDPDVARFGVVALADRQTLGEYTLAAPSLEITLVGEAAGAGGVADAAARLRVDLVAAPATTTGPPGATDPTGPAASTGSTGSAGSADPSGAMGPTDPSGSTGSTGPTGSSGPVTSGATVLPTGATGPDPSAGEVPAGVLAARSAFRLPDDLLVAVRDRPDLDGLPTSTPLVALQRMPLPTPTAPTTPAGTDGPGVQPPPTALSPDEVAAHIEEALSVVEVRRDDDGRGDPWGFVVTVTVETEGLQGVPLLLTWSLNGITSTQDWQNEQLAFRLVPQAPSTSDGLDVWVPDLVEAGEYRVNLRVRRESDLHQLSAATPLAISQTEPVGELTTGLP